MGVIPSASEGSCRDLRSGPGLRVGRKTRRKIPRFARNDLGEDPCGCSAFFWLCAFRGDLNIPRNGITGGPKRTEDVAICIVLTYNCISLPYIHAP